MSQTVRLPCLSTLVLLAAACAHANTYLFSFTGQDALNALLASHRSTDGFFTGTTNFQESAYFGLWVKPDAAAISSFTYLSSNSPNPASTTPWGTTTISDPADLGQSGTFVQFSKYQNVTAASVLSAANGGTGGANIFNNATYWDANTTIVGFGTTHATLNILDPTSVFRFTLDTAQTLSGTIHLVGLASEIRSGSTTSLTSAKTYADIGFGLDVTPSLVTPEPGSLILLGGGGGTLGLTALLIRRKRRTNAYTKA